MRKRIDIRQVRQVLAAFSDLMATIALSVDVPGPTTESWRRTGETLFRNPDGVAMRLLRRAYRLTPAEMADEFTAFDLGLRLALLVTLFPEPFGARRLTMADLPPADRAAIDDLLRRCQAPPSDELP